jgi:hypothetical protein
MVAADDKSLIEVNLMLFGHPIPTTIDLGCCSTGHPQGSGHDTARRTRRINRRLNIDEAPEYLRAVVAIPAYLVQSSHSGVPRSGPGASLGFKGQWGVDFDVFVVADTAQQRQLQGGSIFGTPVASQASTNKRTAQSSIKHSMSYGYAAFDVLIVPYMTDSVRRTWLLCEHLLIARRQKQLHWRIESIENGG